MAPGGSTLRRPTLLQALLRRGKLTAVEAALESSLTVEEAERMLEALAAKGHLTVTVESTAGWYTPS